MNTQQKNERLVDDIIDVLIGTDEEMPVEYNSLPLAYQYEVMEQIHRCPSCQTWFALEEVDNEGLCMSCKDSHY